ALELAHVSCRCAVHLHPADWIRGCEVLLWSCLEPGLAAGAAEAELTLTVAGAVHCPVQVDGHPADRVTGHHRRVRIDILVRVHCWSPIILINPFLHLTIMVRSSRISGRRGGAMQI